MSELGYIELVRPIDSCSQIPVSLWPTFTEMLLGSSYPYLLQTGLANFPDLFSLLQVLFTEQGLVRGESTWPSYLVPCSLDLTEILMDLFTNSNFLKSLMNTLQLL